MSVQRIGPRGAGLTVSAPNIERLIAEVLPGASGATAALDELGANSFQQKVEKHISDYRSGNGNLSSDIGDRISAKAEALAGQLDPRSSRNFTAYSTGLRYDQKARYLNNLSDTFARIKRIIA